MGQIGRFGQLYTSSLLYLEKKRFVLTWPTWCIFVMLFFTNLITVMAVLPKKPFLTVLIYLSVSTLTASVFIVVGTLVWLYAIDRVAALPFYMAGFFGACGLVLQCSASLSLFSVLIDIFYLIGLLCLLVFLMLFPVGIGGVSEQGRREKSQLFYWMSGARVRYLFVWCILGSSIVGLRIGYAVWGVNNPTWPGKVLHLYLVCGVAGCFLLAGIAYRHARHLRELQQLRFMVGGAILAILPFLVVTVLPRLFGLPAYETVDPRVSSLIFVLIALMLGYAVFRYQLLVFDRKMVRLVGWLVGVPGLVVLAYLIVVVGDTFWRGQTLLSDIFEAVALAWLAPIIWKVSQYATDRLFFSELATYNERLQNPRYFVTDVSDRKAVALPFIRAIETVVETSPTCLFLFDEEAGYYSLYPALDAAVPDDAQRRLLLESVLQAVNPVMDSTMDFLSLYEPLIERLAKSPRPLFLSEACFANHHDMHGYKFSLKKATYVKPFEPLLLPLSSQGKLIGLVIIGSRNNHAFYAGVDFEALDIVQRRFSPQFETALLYAQGNRHVDILNAMYITGTMPLFKSAHEVAMAYAKVAAEAIMAAAEIWLFDESTTNLRCLIHEGFGPYLPTNQPGILEAVRAANWQTFFYEGHTVISPVDAQQRVPPCFPSAPGFPLAWIPLMRAQRPLGALVLTYPRPHLFSHAERRIFELFANQCAAVLENTLITQELRAAYAQQKELDRLKDQFIMTASHELRTPLTAIQGYIELLDEYRHQLTPEVRDEFIAKAHRGCDELSLMVGNIMDASRIQDDAEHMSLEPIVLSEAVQHAAEILAPMLLYGNHDLEVDLPEGLLVLANDLHLRQVLLNLIGNALKYSPSGQKIAVSCVREDETITICVRDFGPGVPPEEQFRLFERFVRLDRDMNSPIRGAGLGLYISKFLIEAMGGKIWVESQGIPGKGSTFAFTVRPAQAESESQMQLMMSAEVAQQRQS